MGNSTKFADMNGQQIMEKILDFIDEKEFLLVAAVNIHTKQADNTLEFLEDLMIKNKEAKLKIPELEITKIKK